MDNTVEYKFTFFDNDTRKEKISKTGVGIFRQCIINRYGAVVVIISTEDGTIHCLPSCNVKFIFNERIKNAK